jgi:hypothetical protein
MVLRITPLRPKQHGRSKTSSGRQAMSAASATVRTKAGLLPLSEVQPSQSRSSGSVWAESFMLLRTCLFREPTLGFCLWHDDDDG